MCIYVYIYTYIYIYIYYLYLGRVEALQQGDDGGLAAAAGADAGNHL